MDDKANILIAIRPALYADLFSNEADQQLRELGDLTFQSSEDNLTSKQLARQIGGYDIVVTGWGTPVFNDEVLAAADRLRLIVHSAGTIKRLLPPATFANGRRITHAAAAMAVPVAETTLLLILLSLRQVHKIDRAFREDSWAAAKALPYGSELAGQRVGVVGAGHTGRAVIRRLQAMDAQLSVFDPYLSEEEAKALGVKKAPLEPLMRESSIVTLQAPSTAETNRMIGAEQFSWLRDGALFINTARTHLIDEAALLAELQSGRISAALDVFEQEPLPNDSPFRTLENVILTPHISSDTVEARLRQGQIVADEVGRFLNEGKLRYEVTRAMLDTMA